MTFNLATILTETALVAPHVHSSSGFRHWVRTGRAAAAAGVPGYGFLAGPGYFMPTPISTSQGES